MIRSVVIWTMRKHQQSSVSTSTSSTTSTVVDGCTFLSQPPATPPPSPVTLEPSVAKQQQAAAASDNVDKDHGYDTCGIFHLPPHRENANISLALDLTDALSKLRASAIKTSDDCEKNGAGSMVAAAAAATTTAGKYRYFLETNVDFKKTCHFIQSDIECLWDIYCIVCRHTFMCYNNSPPKLVSDCRRHTTNTDTEYKIILQECVYHMSITFGVCSSTSNIGSTAAAAATTKYGLKTVSNSISTKLAQLMHRHRVNTWFVFFLCIWFFSISINVV